jgi:hypothetical protein
MDEIEAKVRELHQRRQPSWLERSFGPSYQTSLAGYGGGVLALTCIILGRVLAVTDLITAGLGLLATSIILIGQLARSQAQHEADKKAGRT